MWKKTEYPEEQPQTPPLSTDERAPAMPSRPREAAREPATIGPSISIRGDLSGEEDLLIRGRVEGTINLRQNSVIVGEEGRINATVYARGIRVEGQVDGDLFGEEQVVVKRSGNVRGNISSPRVTLEDGCRFKGAIDMEAKPRDAGQARAAASPPVLAGVAPESRPVAEPGGNGAGNGEIRVPPRTQGSAGEAGPGRTGKQPPAK